MRGAADPRLVALLLLAAASATVAACGSSDEEEEGTPFARQVLEARAETAVVAPVTLPPELERAWVTIADGVALLNFYSTNSGVVTVCTAKRAQCRALEPGAREIRSEVAGGEHALVTVGRSDNPSSQPGLRPAVARFWSGVRLTAGAPAWVEAD